MFFLVIIVDIVVGVLIGCWKESNVYILILLNVIKFI